jgi:hypothetical protein
MDGQAPAPRDRGQIAAAVSNAIAGLHRTTTAAARPGHAP